MTKPINPGTAILFLLKREYIKECKIETVANDQGEESDRAVHPNGWSFEQWLTENKMIVQPQSIIQTQTPKIELLK
jgi:hypothetical protein